MMAKRKVNKTAVVKEYLDANPNAGPSEVVAALAEKKINVTANYVSNIKSKSKSGGKRVVRRGRKAASVKASANGSLSGKLAEAIDLVEKVGGIEKARETLDAVKALERN
jgi:hypothetical protein